eukprot:4759532-Alexandrium_andersonii.AAC.1
MSLRGGSAPGSPPRSASGAPHQPVSLADSEPARKTTRSTTPPGASGAKSESFLGAARFKFRTPAAILHVRST